MDVETIRACLCEVIAEVQTISGLDCPSLTGGTKPARDVKDFSSEVWPVAIAMLEERTGIEISEDENLFYDAKSKLALTLDQCVEKVMVLAQKQVEKDKETPDE